MSVIDQIILGWEYLPLARSITSVLVVPLVIWAVCTDPKQVKGDLP